LTERQGKQLLILAARADYLGDLRERKRITDEEYVSRLNELRQQAGLQPLLLKTSAPPGSPQSSSNLGNLAPIEA